MENKPWNVRDETDASLMQKLTETYKAIDAGYKMVEEAEMKRQANEDAEVVEEAEITERALQVGVNSMVGAGGTITGGQLIKKGLSKKTEAAQPLFERIHTGIS